MYIQCKCNSFYSFHNIAHNLKNFRQKVIQKVLQINVYLEPQFHKSITESEIINLISLLLLIHLEISNV